MPDTVRWNLTVSREVDATLRQVLASHGEAQEGALARFVEDAVRDRIIEVEAEAAKHANEGRSEAEIADAVEEALGWARSRA